MASTASRTPRERDRALIVGAVGVTIALWASAFVAIRFADRQLSPGALALGRLLVGAIALGLLVLARREPLPRRREVAPLPSPGRPGTAGRSLAAPPR